MATYTHTFIEYMGEQMGQLPEIFNDFNIDIGEGHSFNDLFVLHFSAYEIGAETFAEFDNLLKARALELLPFYKKKIDAINAALVQPFNNGNKITLTTNNTGKNYDNPLNSTGLNDADISSALITDSVTTEEHEGTNTRSNKIDVVIQYQDAINNLYSELLEKFNVCFMQMF